MKNNKQIVLQPLTIELKGNNFVRSCLIQRKDNNVVVKEQKLWFQFSTAVKPPRDRDCDAYLVAILMDAMQEKRSITIKGSISQKLLANLIEYQGAWNKWLPQKYYLVDINVETIRRDEAPLSGAICAFSGGVDATFSVWRHTQHKLKYGCQDIALCALIHGFDIPLKDQDAFEKAQHRATQTLKDVALNLIPLATNYRHITKVSWEHSHACALVAALNNFKQTVGNCIIGSTEPYSSLVIPWGSSPITDHLLSSGDFNVIHDGASYNRTEKAQAIAEWKVGTDNLRVCWEGDHKDRNCGVCEKCIRTKLNFLASGNPIPNCFPKTANLNQDIQNVQLKNDVSRAYWREIVAMAKSNQINDQWVKLAEKVIKKKLYLEIFLPQGSYQRNLARNLKQKTKAWF